MPVEYNTQTLNSRLQVVVNNIDAGAGVGVMRIGTANMSTVLSSINLQKPCGTVSAGVLTFSGLPLIDPLTINSGIAAEAQIEDSSGTVVVGGLTVGVSSAFDVIMSNTAISSNQTVALVFATITGN